MTPDSVQVINQTVEAGYNWIAVLGAGAWIPWIIFVILKYVVKPDIKIINFRKILTINNSFNAPFITVPLSVVSRKKSATIYKMEMRIKDVESGAEKVSDCYSSSDATIRQIIAKDGPVYPIAIFPIGITLVERDKPVIGDFSFRTLQDVEKYETLYFDILRISALEKEKDSNFVPDAAWVKGLDQVIELKKHFKKMASWNAGEYIITIRFFTYERKKPYAFEFKGALEQFKADKLADDYERFNRWAESDDFVEQRNVPLFNYANMNIDPLPKEHIITDVK